MTHDDANLLVAEDEPFLGKAVVASLRFLGFRVTAADNGTDALRRARNRPFDLLILDVMLPGIEAGQLPCDGGERRVLRLAASIGRWTQSASTTPFPASITASAES